MAAYLYLRVTIPSSRRGMAVDQQYDIFLPVQTTLWTIPLNNENWTGANEIYVLKGSYNTRLTTETWRRIDERKDLRALLMVLNGGERGALEYYYREKVRDMQCSVHGDKRNSIHYCVGE